VSGAWYIPPRADLETIPKPSRVKGDRWGYCGIAAISAATAVPPLKVLQAIPDWPGYTPMRMVLSTLEKLGFGFRRVLVPKDAQRQWPTFEGGFPSTVAIGRIYWGEGKWADSHYVVFRWPPDHPWPYWYDNALKKDEQSFMDGWAHSSLITFEEVYGACRDCHAINPEVRLKSLYFVIRRAG
jgi:hypothetical protein